MGCVGIRAWGGVSEVRLIGGGRLASYSVYMYVYICVYICRRKRRIYLIIERNSLIINRMIPLELILLNKYLDGLWLLI